ncbi:hypothetical protein [Georgenia yuyongxinii]
MSHLGEDVTALVDAQLPPGRTEELLAHVVACEECAAAIAIERDARLRLAAARDVTPSVKLTSRLIAMAAEPPRDDRGARAFVDVALRPLTSGRTRRRLAARSGLVLAGAAGVAGALVIVGTLAERTGDPSAMLAQLTGAAPGRSQPSSPPTPCGSRPRSAPPTPPGRRSAGCRRTAGARPRRCRRGCASATWTPWTARTVTSSCRWSSWARAAR